MEETTAAAAAAATTSVETAEDSANSSVEEPTKKDESTINDSNCTDGNEEDENEIPTKSNPNSHVPTTTNNVSQEEETTNKNNAKEEDDDGKEKENLMPAKSNDHVDADDDDVQEEDQKTTPPPPEDTNTASDTIIETSTREEPTDATATTTTNNSSASLPNSPAHSQSQHQPQTKPQTTTTITANIPNKPSHASTEIIQSLFGPTVGVCWGDFSCQYNHVRGRLYASSEAVLFYSNLFGFEKKINLSYNHVEQMNLFRQTSIQVTLQDDQEYVFKGFSDRSQTLGLLIELWRESQGLDEDEAEAEAEVATSIADHNNSTVSEPITALSPTTTTPTEVQTPQSVPYTPPTMQSQMATTRTPNHNNPTLLPDLPSALRKRSKSVPNLHRRRKQSPNKTKSNKPKQETQDTNNSKNNNTNTPEDDDFDWEQAPTESDQTNWKDAKTSKKPWVKEVGIESMQLNCSLQSFFELFLANKAPYSLENYQTSNIINDRNVGTTFWETTKDNNNVLTRLIKFEHPVSASFGVGPSHAPTKRYQTLVRYPQLGICVTSKSTVEGLPGSECFEVEDVWIIEQTNGVDEIRFSAKFGANFFKFTFLKSIIDKNIKAGNKEWYEGYRRMVERALEKNNKGTAAAHTAKASPDASASTTIVQGTHESKKSLLDWMDGKAFALALMICQLFILLVIVFLVYELRMSHRTSEALLEEMKLLRLQHGQVLNQLVEGEK